MAQHILQLALLTLCACTIGANNAEVEKVCGNNASFICIGDFTRPNPVRFEKTCRQAVAKENAARTENNILIKFLMINYNKKNCEEFNDRININKNLLKRLYCDDLKSTSAPCPQVTSESPLETTSEQRTCTKITSKPCSKSDPHCKSPVPCGNKKPLGNSKKQRKANKKQRKNNKKKHNGKKQKVKKTIRKSKPCKYNKKNKYVKKNRKNCLGKVKKNTRKSKPATNHCPCQAT